jgi:ketosteroid isomerase-like protein
VATLGGGDEGGSDAALRRERELWEAYRSSDAARLRSLIHPDALDVGLSGILDREGVLAAVARMEIVDFTIEDFSIRSFEDIEIATYRSTVEGTFCGEPFRTPAVVATTVWRRVEGRWTVVHRHESAAP